jgi:hypothetical protein
MKYTFMLYLYSIITHDIFCPSLSMDMCPNPSQHICINTYLVVFLSARVWQWLYSWDSLTTWFTLTSVHLSVKSQQLKVAWLWTHSCTLFLEHESMVMCIFCMHSQEIVFTLRKIKMIQIYPKHGRENTNFHWNAKNLGINMANLLLLVITTKILFVVVPEEVIHTVNHHSWYPKFITINMYVGKYQHFH